jgi:glycosyltransferase involved in cell wall biosynthesis
MQISVIIPTYNRAKILQQCLEALFKQDFPDKDYEVIVVDDGSNDNTSEVVRKLKIRHDNLHYFHQQNQGQGIARNTGVSHAKGHIIVFIGDDIVVRPDFLTEHIRFHLRHPEENAAVLGFVTWHPQITITPFMNWLTNGSSIFGKFGGHQFAYEKLKGKQEADYNFFYTANISLKRNLVDKYPFDPSFSVYGWEDIELGYRLHNRVGLKLYYNSMAIGYHNHSMTVESMAGRMRSIGKSAWIIDAKYPELKKVPDFRKKLALILISNPIAIAIFSFIRNVSQGYYDAFYYYALSKKYFLEGLKEGEEMNRKHKMG